MPHDQPVYRIDNSAAGRRINIDVFAPDIHGKTIITLKPADIFHSMRSIQNGFDQWRIQCPDNETDLSAVRAGLQNRDPGRTQQPEVVLQLSGGVLNRAGLFLISVLFYVCDLICVLIWCPFRLLMRTRCCTTCRIFNWDHLMMFSPMIFLGGFYAVSLIVLAFLAWLVWELCIMMYPERFWDKSNAALKCSECTDKLCTQYCRKLRK